MPATLTRAETSADPGVAAWSRALRDLPDVPYKVETNARGQLILSPPKPEHGFAQASIGHAIREALGPSVATEFGVRTSDGIKVPDVIWISNERKAEIPEGAEFSSVMPELCVEVLSASNTQAEMERKRALYFEDGAKEVWLAEREDLQNVSLRFFTSDGETEQSKLAPDFPKKLQA